MLQAIETTYNGYRFRSRLKARWAVFLDALGIAYEYEKEGYVLDGLCYLPDFWLPELQYFIEIKGQAPTEEEHTKALQLAQQSGHKVFIFEGSIEVPTSANFQAFATEYAPRDKSLWTYGPLFIWVECPICRKLDLATAGLVDSLWSGCTCLKAVLGIAPKRLNGEAEEAFKSHEKWWSDKAGWLRDWMDSPRLVAAYEAARQARFEHGEKGQKR